MCGIVYWKVLGLDAGPKAPQPPAPVPAVAPAASSREISLFTPRNIAIAVVVLGVVLLVSILGIKSMARTSHRAKWLPLAESASRAAAMGEAKLISFGTYGEVVPSQGKVGIWSMADEKPDNFGIKSSNLAHSPEECGTFLMIKKGIQQVGTYSNGIPAVQHYAAIYSVDMESDELIFAVCLLGPMPKAVITTDAPKGTDGPRGVDDKLTKWLEEYVGQ